MSVPVSSRYPQAYDSLGTLAFVRNTTRLTVKYPLTTASLQCVVNEDCSQIQPPVFLIFEGGEIWYCEQITQTAQGEWVFVLTDLDRQRGLYGSPLQPHVAGERIYLSMMGDHLNQLKRALLQAQRYRFLVGPLANRPSSPVAGERYLATDTRQIFYCFVDGVWTLVPVKHGDLQGLQADDHPQYQLASPVPPYESAEADAWHNALGDHITDGDDHNHLTEDAGLPVVRLRAGLLADRGAPQGDGDVYYATDEGGGTLYIAMNGVWEALSGIPSGAIGIFMGACPSGWSRFTALDGRYPYGHLVVGQTGGATTHTHTYNSFPAHYHVIAGGSPVLSTDGLHSHSISTGSTAGASSALKSGGGDKSSGVDDSGSHTHTVVTSEVDTAVTGVSSPSTSGTTSEPPYQEVIFCVKL